MDFSEVRDHPDQECDFPVAHGTLVARVGGVELDAQTTGAAHARSLASDTSCRCTSYHPQ